MFRTIVLVLSIVPVLCASFQNIREQINAVNALIVAKEIENSDAVSTKLADATLRHAIEKGAGLSCQDDISRSVATIEAYLLNQRMEESLKPVKVVEYSKSALAAVDHRLFCSPVDGNAWLMRAELLQFEMRNGDDVAASLKESYQFAPAESWIMDARFNFAAANVQLVDRRLSAQFSADLKLLVGNASPYSIARDYVKANGQVRLEIAQDLAIFSERRRELVARETNRLGLILRATSDCSIDRIDPFGEKHNLITLQGYEGICG